VIGGVTEVEHITTKQDMSRWTRAHADVPGIRWSVFAGPGGTMIIVEHAEDRCAMAKAGAVRNDAAPVPVNAPVTATAPVTAPAVGAVGAAGAAPVSA
jgi:hypothetical protein